MADSYSSSTYQTINPEKCDTFNANNTPIKTNLFHFKQNYTAKNGDS